MKISRDGKTEGIFTLFLLSFFVFIFLGALKFPKDAQLFPMVLSVPCIIASLFLLIKCLKENRLGKDGNEIKEKHSFLDFFPYAFGPLYFLSVYFLGYLISTAAVMIIVPLLLGYKNKKAIVITVIVVFIAVIVIFRVLLSMKFYPGLLGLI